MNFYIVSSTHWDREWYEPFQKYRFRLVRMMDSLLDILENEPEYKSFHMDGQTIVLQDYLRIRPENADRLSALIKAGRIEIGPWYTMPEEWLVSGESLVKNLQTGRRICGEYGVKSSPCGYVCDLFGHNSQMPQIFRQFGLNSTAFFRGIEERKDMVVWEGADGSRILVNKMHRDYAYSTFYFVVRYPFELREYDPKELGENFRAFVEREKKEGGFALDNILLMDGVDHIDPERNLPALIEALRKAFPEHTFTHCNMEAYFKKAEEEIDRLETYTGCLYDVAADGVNQAVLKNCASSIVDQKQDNSYCETALEQVLSPLNFYATNAALRPNGKHYYSAAPYNGFLEEAWNLLLQNHAHDSICGCSVTATHLDTKNRFKNAREIVEVVQKNLLEEIAQSIGTDKKGEYDGAWLVCNHGQTDISGACVVELPLATSPWGRNLRIFDEKGNQLDYAILDSNTDFEKDTRFNIVIRFPETEHLKAVLPLEIPAEGYTTLFYKRLKTDREPGHWEFSKYAPPYRLGGSMRGEGLTFDTGEIVVKIKKNGTLKVVNKRTGRAYDDLLSFTDGGDVGEGWNWVAPEHDTVYTTMACDADVAVEQDNALCAVIRIVNRMHLPVSADWRRRSSETKEFVIDSTVTLVKGSSRIDVVTKVNNRIVNHRLRAVFPTGMNAEKFRTQLPFDLYSWNVKKKDNTYCKEKETNVNPNQGAVAITEGRDTFAVYNKGLYEASVFDDEGRTAALTLFRSFTNETGCVNHTGLGTMQGEYVFEYAMDFLDGADNADILRRAYAFKAGVSARETDIHAGKLPLAAQFVKVSGKAVVSILQGHVLRQGEWFNEIRIYDVDGGDAGTLSFFKPVKKAYRTDLKGDILEECKVKDGKIRYELKNRQIATFLFQF